MDVQYTAVPHLNAVRERTVVGNSHKAITGVNTMKYFTKKLWTGRPFSLFADPAPGWDKARRAYRTQLAALRPQFAPDVFAFFEHADIHEGELLRIDVADGSRAGPLDQPLRPWTRPRNHPVRVELVLLDVYDRLVWTLHYATVRRVVIDFPSMLPLAYRDGEGFGAIGFHELTACGAGFYRHALLFASGATLLVEFKDVTVRSDERTPGGM
jgi:hypothetical protein